MKPLDTWGGLRSKAVRSLVGATIGLLAFAALLLAAPCAAAHDLWLIPPVEAKAGAPLKVQAISGGEFPKGDHAPDPAKFAKRRLFDPVGKETAVEAGGTEELAGLLPFTPAAAGVHVIAVETTPKIITLEADAFNAYLVGDGLEHVYRLRAKEKTLGEAGRERYSKFPKALVRVGDGKAGDPCRAVGLPLEIVPTQDPFGRKVGDTLKVKVLFRGKPLADANLGWMHPGDETPAGTVRTDSKGEALVPVAKTGLMSIRLTHMTRPKDKDFEWESFWTTLTFHIPD